MDKVGNLKQTLLQRLLHMSNNFVLRTFEKQQRTTQKTLLDQRESLGPKQPSQVILDKYKEKIEESLSPKVTCCIAKKSILNQLNQNYQRFE